MRTMLSPCVLAALVAASPAARADDSPIGAWLRQGRTDLVDRQLTTLQQRFEAGTASEVELRDAYRAFYVLDAAQEAALSRWANQSARSYAARLALGVHLRHAATDARGEQYRQDTPVDDLQRADALAARAQAELDASTPLTAKPYLGPFHRMEIDGVFGSRTELRRDEQRASRLLPGNYMARARYVNFTLPRWGGSYAEVDAFIAQARAAGAPPSAIARLEAAELSDKAHVLADAGKEAAAEATYRAAMDKAPIAGGDVLDDELKYARRVVCWHEPQHANRPAPSTR